MKQPILASPNFNESFIVQTDASEKGIGCVLSQHNEIGENGFGKHEIRCKAVLEKFGGSQLRNTLSFSRKGSA